MWPINVDQGLGLIGVIGLCKSDMTASSTAHIATNRQVAQYKLTFSGG